MSKAMGVLIDMQGILQEMQNLEKQIDGIDSNVRNRPYTAKELMEERALEAEKAEKRKELNALKQMLARLLEDKNESDTLKAELLEKYQRADNSEKMSKYGLYLEWIKEASSINTKKGQLNRVRNSGGQADNANRQTNNSMDRNSSKSIQGLNITKDDCNDDER